MNPITDRCPDCQVIHAFRWIEPPGAYFAECPRQSRHVGGATFLAKPLPNGRMMILMAPGMTVANFTIQRHNVGYHDRSLR